MAEPLHRPMALVSALQLLCRVHTQEDVRNGGFTIRMGATPEFSHDMEWYTAAWAEVRRTIGLPTEPDPTPPPDTAREG